MRIRVLAISAIVLLCFSCFEADSEKKSKAEHLLLNQCDHIITVTKNLHCAVVSDSTFALSCSCIADVLAEELIQKKSLEELEEMENVTYELLKEIGLVIESKETRICEKCFER